VLTSKNVRFLRVKISGGILWPRTSA